MIEAMERCHGVQTRAAEILGMTFRSFRYFAKKYGLSRGDALPTPDVDGEDAVEGVELESPVAETVEERHIRPRAV